MFDLWKEKRKKIKFISRCEQDLNLRGKIPLDFKSNGLTTRPSQQQTARGQFSNSLKVMLNGTIRNDDF